MNHAYVPYPGTWCTVTSAEGTVHRGIRAWRQGDGRGGLLQLATSRFLLCDNVEENPARDQVAAEVLTCLYTQREVECNHPEVYETLLHVALTLLSDQMEPNVEAMVRYLFRRPGIEKTIHLWQKGIWLPYSSEES